MSMPTEPWDQDTGLDGLEDDAEVDEDGEELADHHEPVAAPRDNGQVLDTDRANNQRLRMRRPTPRDSGGNSHTRIKRMSANMQRAFPQGKSLLLTLDDGRQILFVKG